MTLRVAFVQEPDVDAFRLIRVEIRYQRFWWSLTDKHYECVHGFFHVLQLLPDKLATALSIRESNLPNPEDDGRYLIQIVLNLLEVCVFFYRSLLAERRYILKPVCSNFYSTTSTCRIVFQTSTTKLST